MAAKKEVHSLSHGAQLAKQHGVARLSWNGLRGSCLRRFQQRRDLKQAGRLAGIMHSPYRTQNPSNPENATPKYTSELTHRQSYEKDTELADVCIFSHFGQNFGL